MSADEEAPRMGFGSGPPASTSAAADESSEEEDYMSADILANCPDIRPGVVSGHTAKKYATENAMRARNVANSRKRKAELETERREEALATPVGQDNKGFALMSKMGYRPGQGLGKRADAITEPLPIELKNDRKGIGHQAEMERRTLDLLEQYRLESVHRRVHATALLGNFRSRKRAEAALKQTLGDVAASAKAAVQLDQKAGLDSPALLWFWPPGAVPEPTDDDGAPVPHDFDDALEPAAKLAILTSYLRSSHRYCLWCGRDFESEDALTKACPGDTKHMHDEGEL